MWYAKPAGGYTRTSTEGNGNIFEIWGQMQASGYCVEAASGALGNVQAESGFNPWRWQSDHVNTSGGYGLFQYTPASGYLALAGTTPNMSTTQQTAGSTPQDGARQVDCFMNNELHKWVSSAWRSYWSTTTYSDLYQKRNVWLQAYGSGGTISMAQFAACNDIEAATFFFLACFEGPAVPNYSTRFRNAEAVYKIITGQDPPTPPIPPMPPVYHTVPVWLMAKMAENNRPT